MKILQFDIVASDDKLAEQSNVTLKSLQCLCNFSDTSSLKFLKTKGSIGHAFTVCIHTENQNQRSFYPFVLREISVLSELLLGHLRYRLADVPPQPNSPPDYVSRVEPSTPKSEVNSRSNASKAQFYTTK